jgi:hypothetical protein
MANVTGALKPDMRMVYNILNGDALAYSFPDAGIEGEIVVLREALIEGDLSGENLPAFRAARARFLGWSETAYYDRIGSEFEKIENAREGSVFNLWFEYDLFCQVNLWFVISIIHELPIQKEVFIVYPSHLDRDHPHFWNGLGPANTRELQACFAKRIPLTNADLELGTELWAAYKTNNFETLKRLSENFSVAFPYLQDVVKAHTDRFPQDGTKGRPERVIEDIIQNISPEFRKVLEVFWSRESIYGFGDTQLKRLYDNVMAQQSLP